MRVIKILKKESNALLSYFGKSGGKSNRVISGCLVFTLENISVQDSVKPR